MQKQIKPGPYVFFFDIDGTLYDHFAGMDRSVPDTLYKLREAGHTLCLNTGRAKYFIPDCILDFPFDGIVAGSGTYVEYQGQVLQDLTFSKSFTRGVYEAFALHGIPFTLESAQHNYMSAGMVDHTLARFAEVQSGTDGSQAVRLQPGKYELRANISEYSSDLPIHKVSFYSRDETMPLISEIFAGKATVALEKPDTAGYYYGEAIPAGCCKSNGAALLCSYARLSYDRTAAVGDGPNDMDMIAWAALGVAMGNACDELKQIADHVCLPLDRGGISSLPDYFSL